MNDIADIRKEYKLQLLNETDLSADPILQFAKWWQQALESKIDEVNAMTLCTVSESGQADGRIVLLKGFNEKGFTFFTNYNSKKGSELQQTKAACIVFFWKELERQVRINGTVEMVTAHESDAYFASRPKGSQLGALASAQSSIVKNREELETALQKLELAYVNSNVPRPSHWGGYRVLPEWIEFWQGRPNRLHDRLLYTKANDGWTIQRLAP